MSNRDFNNLLNFIIRAEALAAFVAMLVAVWNWLDAGEWSEPIMHGIAAFVCTYFIVREFHARRKSTGELDISNVQVIRANRLADALRDLRDLIDESRLGRRYTAGTEGFLQWKADCIEVLKKHFGEEKADEFQRLVNDAGDDQAVAINLAVEFLERLFSRARDEDLVDRP